MALDSGGNVKIVIKGVKQLQAKLQKMAAGLPLKMQRAMIRAALPIERKSRINTPVRYGILRATHRTEPVPTTGGGNVAVRISVGGPAAEYAAIVHEDLTKSHKTGQAKFLETAINEAIPGFAADVAAHLQVL